MKKLQDTEYMYGSTRVRVLENRIPSGDRILALCDAKSVGEVMSRLSELGISPAEGDSRQNASPEAVSKAREAMLMGLMRQAFLDVEEAAPDPEVFAWLRYPYDCNNIKMALKCRVRSLGAEETGAMMFDFGSVTPSSVIEAVRDEKYDALPPCFREAAEKAAAAFQETGDPRRIDSLLDCACFRGMTEAAAATGEPALIRWMQAKTDLLNAVITLRILRMRRGEMGRLFLEDSLLPGGTLDRGFFLTAYNGGEDALWTALGSGRMPSWVVSFAKRAEKSGMTLASVEKALDDSWTELIRADAKAPFGASVLAGYILGWETAVKNIRIVLAAKEAGLEAAATRERVRESYV
ncbi:MAG: V-type ATPase subunit [Clostridia bacterium]|nr:V-type ATPase subunit [Clostridia bacterium]